MRKAIAILAVAAFAALPLTADKYKDEDRLVSCGQVMKEVLNIPDDIPQSLIDRAECVIVLPSVLKGGFIVGGSYGRGAMTCRSGDQFNGPWGAPTMMAMEGGSVGFQAGGQATDYVLLVMNEDGARAILSSKVKLGGDASAAIGPLGRDASASTDATMRAEVLSYSRTRGVFAGIALDGASLRPDDDANQALYGKYTNAREIVLHGVFPPPESAKGLLSVLNQHSPVSAHKPSK